MLDELVRLLIEGKLYLFAGAGVSCLAGLPSWKKLLKEFAGGYEGLPNNDKNIVKELPALIENCETVIIDHLLGLGTEGQRKYAEILKNTFRQDVCSDVHEWLIELPFAGYITTNYDLCFEKACLKRNLKLNLIDGRRFCYPPHRFEHDAKNIRDLSGCEGPFLLHMHGCIEHNGKYDVDNIILTRRQYYDFYNKPEMDCIYDNCFYEHILIVGTSFSDPYFMNKFKERRGHISATNIANRKKCYVLRHSSEMSKSPHSDEVSLDIVYAYFDDVIDAGLRNMINELRHAYMERTSQVPMIVQE